ncbi:MAG: uroporphyrinogen decarboxylase/cobalamine-independent methonine synthase family protein [Anaerolineae bacterium]
MASEAGRDPGIEAIRRLAERVAEEAASPRYDELRQLWWKHNSLIKDRPMVLCRPVSAWGEMVPWDSLVARDPVLRHVERHLRMKIWKIEIADDDVIEPWVEMDAVWADPCSYHDMWGPHVELRRTGQVGGAFTYVPAVKSDEDFDLLHVPDHRINEAETRLAVEKAEEALEGTLPLRLRRVRRGNFISLGNTASYLFGLDQLLYLMMERPQWVHRMMAFLRDAHIRYFQNAERDGLLSRNDDTRFNFLPRYVKDLPQSDFDGTHVRLKDLWAEPENQEFTVVSPAMCQEFVYQYQNPVQGLFGLNAFGCCESHHGKWHLLRQMPNLRMVSVSPWCSLEEAVREMGDRYALNWRVNPTNIITAMDPAQMREEVEEGLRVAGHTCINVVYQDIETLAGRPDHLYTWSQVTKEVAARYQS